MDEYGTSDGYGGLAGFGGPALDTENAPVVRYQDLHRTHAPASAGAPSVGFGDVAMSMSEGADVPAYGGMHSDRPLYGGGYGAPDDFPLVVGSSGPKVTQIQEALVYLDYLKPGSVTGTYDRATGLAVKALLTAGKAPVPTEEVDEPTFRAITSTADAKKKAATTSATGVKAGTSTGTQTKKTSQRDVVTFLEEFGIGLAEGAAREAGVSRFKDSGKSTQVVSTGKGKQQEDSSNWQTYAIWGGAALLGVGAAYFLYRSYSKSAKGA